MEERSENKYQGVADTSFILGAAIIILIASLLLISSLLFIAGHSISQGIFWLALALTATATGLLCRHYFTRKWFPVCIGIMLCLAAILLPGAYLAGQFYDLSWDGQTYHQEAVIQLANGWNPLRDGPLKTVNSLWINHYPKGAWIPSAALYALTGHIEQGKVFNLLLIVASFLICLSALMANYRQKLLEPLVFSLLAAANPVSMLQSMTFYSDGQLASILVIILALLYSMSVKKDAVLPMMLALCLIIAINIKFTALAYALIICTTILCYLFLKKRVRPARQITAALATSLIAGILFVGYNPYVTNTVRQGHPFYPLAGPGAVDIMTANSPQGFKSMDRLEKLFTSVFSRTGDIVGPEQNHWKWPFTIAREELGNVWPDNRMAGFGPLFSGSILLSLLLIIAASATRKDQALPFAGLLSLIFISALVNPEAWWARYAPQLWLLPVTCAMLGLAIDGNTYRILAISIVLVLGLNLYLVSISCFERLYTGNIYLKSQLAEMKTADSVLVAFQTRTSNRIRLDEAGIRYREVDRLEGPGVKILAFSDTRYKATHDNNR